MSTTSSTTRRIHVCYARQKPRDVTRSAVSKCSSRRRPNSSNGGRAGNRGWESCERRRSSGSRSSCVMKITSFDQFTELARRGTFVPVCKEIVADLLTPVSAFLKIAEHADYAFLLESVEGGEHVGRYSFLGKDPFLILTSRKGRTIIERPLRDVRIRKGSLPR